MPIQIDREGGLIKQLFNRAFKRYNFTAVDCLTKKCVYHYGSCDLGLPFGLSLAKDHLKEPGKGDHEVHVSEKRIKQK